MTELGDRHAPISVIAMGEIRTTTFGIIFVAELPDKTALAALVLATRHRALPVFLGAALALSVQSVVAVAAGSLLTQLDHRYVKIGSAHVPRRRGPHVDAQAG
ncbi:MAG: TMEM165/GDT1 family protein [Sphingomonadaceae bacterium]